MTAPLQVQKLRLRPSQFEPGMYLLGFGSSRIVSKTFARDGVVLVVVRRDGGGTSSLPLNGRLTYHLVVADVHGNRVRMEGCDRCHCGCKYWENDRCCDCGGTEVAGPEVED